MESGWNVWVWLVGVVSRRWVWLLIPTPLVSVIMFFVLVPVLFLITFYVLKKYMKATHPIDQEIRRK